MLKYLIELNGNEIKNVTIGVNIVDKFEEPLDEGHLMLPISTRGYEYDMRGVLSITMQDDDEVMEKFDFLIIKDSVIATSKYGYYSHNLMVVEYTHKLDNYLVHTLTKTKVLNDDTPARFQYHPDEWENANLTFDETTCSGSLNMRGYVQPISIKSRYFSGDSIVIPQVYQPYVFDSAIYAQWDEYSRSTAFIKSTMTGTSQVTLSSTATNWTAVKGNWTIQYGYVNAFDIEVILYTFYIEVVDKQSLSVYDLVDDVISSVSKFGGVESKYYYDSTRIMVIDEDLANELKLIEAPQVFIQKATVRQFLNAVFLYINSISRLNYVEEGLDVLTVDKFNIYNGNFEKGDIANFTTSQDVTHLGSKGIVWGERLLPNNLDEPTMKTPAEKLHNYVRSESVQIREDNFSFLLERQLYKPKKLIFVLPRLEIKSNQINPTTGLIESANFLNIQLDLTSRLIDKEMWILKTITNDFPSPVLYQPFSQNVGMRNNRVENLFWEQGATELKFSEILGYIFESTLITNVIKQAILEWIARNPIVPFIDSTTGKMATRLVYEVYDYENNRELFASNYWRKWKFNFEYITFDDISFSVEREDLSYLKYYGETRQNQSDKLSNISLLSRKVYGDIQRAGVPTQTFSKYHEKLSTVYPRGSVDSDGNVIVTKKFNLHNNYLLLTYMTTKDHNRLSEFIGIDQLYRWSEIPTSKQVFQRQELYKDYLYICPIDVENMTNEITKLNRDTALYLIFGVLKNNVGLSPYEDTLTKITHAYVRTDGFLENYPDEDNTLHAITTPVASFGIKGGFVFSFGFESNQVAGDKIKRTSTGLFSGTYWKEPVRYTDNLGRFNELWFQLSTRFTIDNDNWEATLDDPLNSREYNLPLVRTIGDGGYESGFGDEVDRVIECGVPNVDNATYDPLIIRKDSSQSIKINYEIGMMSLNYLEFIFGNSFFTENFITKNVYNNPKYAYLYNVETVTYGKFDDLFIKEGWVFKILLSLSNVSFDGEKFEFMGNILETFNLGLAKRWAIGDDQGNLYLACNSSSLGFKVYKKHFRPNLYEIGEIIPEIPPLNYNYIYSDTVYADMEINAIKNPAFNESFDYELVSNMVVDAFGNPIFDQNMNFPLIADSVFNVDAGEFKTEIFNFIAKSNMVVAFAPSYAESMSFTAYANMEVTTDYIAIGYSATHVAIANMVAQVIKLEYFDSNDYEIEANMTSQILGTATPTVGNPICTTTGGINNITVLITNNDTNTVEIRDDFNTLWGTIAGNSSQTFLVEADVDIPYRAVFNITAQATDRPKSQEVGVNQFVNTCNIA